MDEFLYCYKPFEITQSIGFYQFLAMGSRCRLIRSLPLSDRRWKMKFFFVSGCWARNLIEAGRDTFPPYIGEMGCLCSQGMLLTFVSSWISCYLRLTLIIFFSAIAHPSLRKFYLNCIQQARSFVDRTFHSLVTLHRLSTWGLGPIPTNVALAHDLTTRRRKFFTFLHFYLFVLI